MVDTSSGGSQPGSSNPGASQPGSSNPGDSGGSATTMGGHGSSTDTRDYTYSEYRPNPLDGILVQKDDVVVREGDASDIQHKLSKALSKAISNNEIGDGPISFREVLLLARKDPSTELD